MLLVGCFWSCHFPSLLAFWCCLQGYPLPGFAFPSRHYGGVQQQLPTMGPQEQPSHFHSMNTGPVMQQDIDMVSQQQQYPQQPPGYGNGNYQGYNGGYQGPGPVSPQTPTQPMASYQGSYQAEHGYPEAPSANQAMAEQQYPQQPPGYGNGNYQGYNGGYQGPGPVSPQTPTQPMASYQGSYQAEHGYPEAPSANQAMAEQQYPQQPPGYGNGNYQGYNGGYQGPGPVSPQTPTQPMASYQGSYQAEHGYPEVPSANQAMAEFGFEAGPHQSMGITRPASLSLANLSAMSNWQHYYPDGFGVNRPVSPVHKQMQPSRVPYSQQAQSYQSSSYPKKSSSSPGKNQMQGYTGSSCAPRSSTGLQMPGLPTTAYQPPHSPIMQRVTTSVPQQDGGLYGMPHEALTEPQPPFGPSQEQFQQQLQHPHSSCMFVQLGTMPSHLQYQPQQNVTGERTERSKECEELNREDKSLSEKAKGNCSDTSVEVKEVPTVHFQEGAKPQMTGGNPDKTVSDQKKQPPVLLRCKEHLSSDDDERLSVPQPTTCLPPVISKRKGIQTVEQPTITPGSAHYHVTSLKATGIDKGMSLLNNQQAIVADMTRHFVKGLIVPVQLPKPVSAELIKANSKVRFDIILIFINMLF